METLLIIVGVLALQVLLQLWVFPRLGIST
jgi:hypothetical protein